MNPKIIERARKLHAMTESPNVNEAAVAAAKLSELMFKYNLDEGLLVEQDEVEFIRHHYRHDKRGGLNWKRVLLHNLARHNFCDTVLMHSGYNAPKVEQDIFGAPHNVEFVIYLYEFLVPEIERLADLSWADQLEEYRMLGTPPAYRVNAVRYKNSFKHGATTAIIKRIRQQRQSQVTTDRHTMALVTAHDTRLSQFLRDEIGSDVRETSQRFTYSRNAYAAGQQAGRNLPINRPIPRSPSGTRALPG